MMVKLALAFTLALAAAQGSIIDSGTVYTRPYFISDGTSVFGNLSSTDGNFSLDLGTPLTGSQVTGGGNMDCDIGSPSCPYGQTYSITAFFPDATSSHAFVTIDGNLVGSLLLGCLAPAPVCPDTFVSLIAQPVTISTPGTYSVPFYATGQIQAAQTSGSPLILDDQVFGIGLLNFSVSTSHPGSFQIDTGPPQILVGLNWVFQPVPEPSMFLPSLLGLAAIQWQRRRKRLS